MDILVRKIIVLSFSLILITMITSSRAVAQWGDALSLNGSNQYGYGNVFSTATDNFTMEAWVYWKGENGNAQLVIENGSNNNGAYGYALALFYQSPYPMGLLYNQMAWVQSSAGTTLPLNTWTHYALVRKAGITSLYQNGNRIDLTGDGEGFDPASAPGTPTGQFRIGSDEIQAFFYGDIDEIRFSDIGRYDGATYSVPSGPFTPDANTLALYHCNEGSGITLTDASGNGNDLILVGGPTWVLNSLPVEMTSFTASAKNNLVELKWSTATEVNNAGFVVERKMVQGSGFKSQNNNHEPQTMNQAWIQAGFVEGSGTSNAPKEYSFVDKNISGKILYRLKQIDRDGKFTYSNEVEVVISQIPQKFALEQNYPNPFNPTTTISFSIPARENLTGLQDLSGLRVSLKIYDALGREVATLVNEEKPAGFYEVQFNASKLSSGIYFYRLSARPKDGGQAGTYTGVKKFVLLR